MTGFVSLRAKMYSYKVGDDEHKKAKRVKKNFDDYKTCLETQQKVYKSMNSIRSRLQTMYTEEIKKIALSADDTQYYILGDKASTLAHGH